jgi:hypothetical protein
LEAEEEHGQDFFTVIGTFNIHGRKEAHAKEG